MSFCLSIHSFLSAFKATKSDKLKSTSQKGRSVSKMGGLFVVTGRKLVVSSSALAVGALLLTGAQKDVSAAPVGQPPVVASSTYTIPTWKDRKIINRPDRASDPDSSVLTWKIVTVPTRGTLAIDSTDGLFLYTPPTNATGVDSFVIGVTDGASTTNVTYTIAIGAAPSNLQYVYTSLGASDNNAIGTNPYDFTKGYTAQILTKLNDRYPGEWVLSNRGVNGFGAHDLVRTVGGLSVLDLLDEDAPEATTLWIGPNDVVRISLAAAAISNPTAQTNYTVAQIGQFSSDLNEITDAIGYSSFTGVVANVPQMDKLPAVIAQVNAIYPASPASARTNALAKINALSLALSQSIKDEADQNNLPVVDLFNDPRISQTANIGPDGFHPSNAGYTILANEFWNTKDFGLATQRYGLRDLLNYAPEAYDNYNFVPLNSTNNVIDVLTDDFDVEGDPLTIVNVTRLTTTNNGTLTITGGGTGLKYTPKPGFTGYEVYSYTISDGVYEDSPATLLIYTEPPVATSGALISEVRFRGPEGPLDEYIEITNTQNTILNVSGWSIAYPAASGEVKITFPSHAFLPPRGSVLYAGGYYSRAQYSVPDEYLPALYPANPNDEIDIKDGSGVVLRNHLNARIDSVGYAGVAQIYREGTGLPLGGPEIGQDREIAFYRDLKTGSAKDTNNNALDFIKTDTEDTSNSNGVRLGAPGPQELLSPTQRNDKVLVTLFDATKAASVAPNRVRLGAGDEGSLIVRRKVTNNTGSTLYALRFRVVDITAGTPAAGTADIRLQSSPSDNIGGKAVLATTLEAPEIQGLNGGGFNSSVSVDVGNSGLAPGASINVQFQFTIRKAGNFSFLMNSEALIEP